MIVSQKFSLSFPSFNVVFVRLNLWIKGHGHLAVKEFSPAASTLSGLDIRPLLYNNVELLASIGEAQFMNGEYSLAMTTLKRVGQ